jgi:hypothetical protein
MPHHAAVKQRMKLLAISGTLLCLSLAATACGGGSPSASGSAPAVTVTAAPPSPAFDTETRTACKEAEASSSGAIGNGHYGKALMAAKLSDVATLRDIEAKIGEAAYSQAAIDQVHTMTAVLEISTWCLDHKVPH